MNAVVAKALNSILKGILGTLITAGIAGLGAFSQALPHGADPVSVIVFGAVVTLIHSAISALEKYNQVKP